MMRFSCGGTTLGRVMFSLTVVGWAEAEHARTLKAWIGAFRINVPSDYSQTFSGVRVKVGDMKCEDLEVGSMSASYVPPRSLRFHFDDIEASCTGDYDWKYTHWSGVSVKGDGKIDAKIHRTWTSLRAVVDADAWGAPTMLSAKDCGMGLNVKDVDLRGDPVGEVANVFVDSFTDWFIPIIEDYVCESLEKYVYADVTALVSDAGVRQGHTPRGVRATSTSGAITDVTPFHAPFRETVEETRVRPTRVWGAPSGRLRRRSSSWCDTP